MDKKILALDQATEISGFSVWKNGELIEYGKHKAAGLIEDRLVDFRKWFNNKIDELLEDGSDLEIAIEGIQLQQIPGQNRDVNVDTFRKLAWIQGICIELCQEKKLKFSIIPSVTWKSTCGVKGSNRAEQKRNAQKFVTDKFSIKATQDESDAICIGFHLNEKANSEINFE